MRCRGAAVKYLSHNRSRSFGSVRLIPSQAGTKQKHSADFQCSLTHRPRSSLASRFSVLVEISACLAFCSGVRGRVRPPCTRHRFLPSAGRHGHGLPLCLHLASHLCSLSACFIAVASKRPRLRQKLAGQALTMHESSDRQSRSSAGDCGGRSVLQRGGPAEGFLRGPPEKNLVEQVVTTKTGDFRDLKALPSAPPYGTPRHIFFFPMMGKSSPKSPKLGRMSW